MRPLLERLLIRIIRRTEAQARELKSAAIALKLQLHIVKAGDEAQLNLALTELAQKRIEALILSADPFFDTQRGRIVAWAAEHRLPAMYQFHEYAVAGGLA